MSSIIPSLTSVASPPEPLDPNEGLCLLTRNLATRAPVDPTHLFTIPRRNPGIQVSQPPQLPRNVLNVVIPDHSGMRPGTSLQFSQHRRPEEYLSG